MNEKQLIQLIRSTMSDFTNQSVPWHVHNGVDSSKIKIQNILILPDIGIPLMNGTDGYNIYVDSGLSELTIEPNQSVIDAGNAILNIGEDTNLFDDIYLKASDSIQLSVNDGVSSNLLDIETTGTTNTYSDGIDTATESLNATLKSYTATGEFAIKLPDATLPSPQAGMIAFNGGSFYGCQDGLTWQVFTLV